MLVAREAKCYGSLDWGATCSRSQVLRERVARVALLVGELVVREAWC